MTPENKKSRCFRTGSDLHFLWWRGFPVTSDRKTSAPPYVLVGGPA